MCEPDYPMQYIGDDNEHLTYGDYVRVIEHVPDGTRIGRIIACESFIVEEYCDQRILRVPVNLIVPRRP